jgi:hypothetical protein
VLGSWSVIRKNAETSTLESDEFRDSYGNLTVGLRLTGAIGRNWQIITLFRWTVLITVLVMLSEYP